ncbi:MAG: hypothetical protein WC554_02860 [Clostridia bacterium]|jgi:hypothetical protein
MEIIRGKLRLSKGEGYFIQHRGSNDYGFFLEQLVLREGLPLTDSIIKNDPSYSRDFLKQFLNKEVIISVEEVKE